MKHPDINSTHFQLWCRRRLKQYHRFIYNMKKREFEQLPFKFINGDDVRRSYDRVRDRGGDDVEKWKDRRL